MEMVLCRSAPVGRHLGGVRAGLRSVSCPRGALVGRSKAQADVVPSACKSAETVMDAEE